MRTWVDEAIFAGIRSAERPTIDCHALLRLAQLLDSLRPARHSAGHEPTITLAPQTMSVIENTYMPLALKDWQTEAIDAWKGRHYKGMVGEHNPPFPTSRPETMMPPTCVASP